MSKRELKKYLNGMTKEQLEDQITDLYGRFKEVKEFYNFAFNPNENKLIEEAKFKISKEYFPTSSRKPKTRRSVAQKLIKHFIRLGVDSHIIANVMLYNIEVAQAFSADRHVKQDSFYTSMLKSYEEALKFIDEHGIRSQFAPPIEKIAEEAWAQDWYNKLAFENLANNY